MCSKRERSSHGADRRDGTQTCHRIEELEGELLQAHKEVTALSQANDKAQLSVASSSQHRKQLKEEIDTLKVDLQKVEMASEAHWGRLRS
jgi:predicted  nucleic acid-binding Zn-ribbon protein